VRKKVISALFWNQMKIFDCRLNFCARFIFKFEVHKAYLIFKCNLAPSIRKLNFFATQTFLLRVLNIEKKSV
jgi:hypothetical protein